MGTIEYRKLFRARVNLEMSFETREASPRKGVLLSSDLSSSGASVIGNEKLDIATELDLTLPVNGGRDCVKTIAKIIWQKQCQYVPKSRQTYHAFGLRFLDMSPEDAVLTSDFIYEIVKTNHEQEEKALIHRFEELNRAQK